MLDLQVQFYYHAMLWTAAAGAETNLLRLDSSHPPVRVSAQEQSEVVRYDFGAARLDVLPAAIVELEPSAPQPPGQWLGGPFWRVASAPDETGVETALAWLSRPGVYDAFPDVVLPREPTSFDDPDFEGQWYLEKLGAQSLYDLSLGDPAVRVAVIDSGIDVAHRDLVNKVVVAYDAHNDDDDPSPNAGEYCSGGATGICDEHGTAVAGIVGAEANNGFGIVGLCPGCSIIAIKMLGEMGSLSADIRAFEAAISADAAVINNSWGYIHPTPAPSLLADAIARASSEPRGGLGALVVFAAGNDDREVSDNEVCGLPDVLCVTAVDSYGQPTAYTNSGDPVDVAAPSATVSIAPGDEIITNFGGTSAAAPVVSGIAGWVVSVDPTQSASDLHDLFIETATLSPLVTPDENGHHDTYGYGEVDVANLIARVAPISADTGADTGAPLAKDDEPKAGCGCGSVAPVGPVALWLFGLGIGWCRRAPRAALRSPS